MALERFHFETSDGDKIDIPFMKDGIRRKAMNKLNKDYKDRQEEMDEGLLRAAKIDKKTMDIIDEMTLRDYQSFMLGWSEQDDVSLGE